MTPVGPPERATLSACVIARDEEARLPDCLASLGFCDEVVVVDSGSTDRTREIARAAGARVVEQPWLGFGAQRNVAIDHARGDWILEVDADERVTEELRGEIETFLAAVPDGVALGGLPLRESFLGRRLGPSAKYPKYRHRLFARGAYRHDEARTVHEGLVPEGPVHAFRGDLLHHLADDVGEALRDTWRYARLEAGQLQAPRDARTLATGLLARPAAKLAFRLVVDGGWRDGPRGLLRIALDCAGDVLVWTRHALDRRGAVHGRSGVAPGLHFGAWRRRAGSLRIAVLASPRGTPLAASWADGARALGADVAVVAAARPVAAARELGAVEQLRPLDAVVTFGRRARLAAAVPSIASDAPRLDGATVVPVQACERAQAARRAQG